MVQAMSDAETLHGDAVFIRRLYMHLMAKPGDIILHRATVFGDTQFIYARDHTEPLSCRIYKCG